MLVLKWFDTTTYLLTSMYYVVGSDWYVVKRLDAFEKTQSGQYGVHHSSTYSATLPKPLCPFRLTPDYI